MKKVSAGFSLVELLVAISIIAILTAVGYVNFKDSTEASRDADRRADLRNLQSALELYKNKNGRYPEGCRGPGTWSGQADSAYACPPGAQYIIGLAPEFISTLPIDPKGLETPTSGYMYTVDSEGSVYKLMVKNTVESEIVTYTSEFKSCDATDSSSGICDATHPSNNKPSWCQENNAQFQSSYALWGGYANVAPNLSNANILIERRTEDVICDVQ
jgi:prepilin-type N-terminal cleavage/methylation domain-containing protein